VSEKHVVLIADGFVWKILHKYARALPSARSQLGRLGLGAGASADSGAVLTVAQKLARCPSVEQVLWLNAAEDWMLNLPRELTRKQLLDFAREHDARVFMFAKLTMFNPKACSTLAALIRSKELFKLQWTLLVCELSACMQDESFKAWAEGRRL